MDLESYILERYGKYHRYIRKLATHYFIEKPQAKDLKITQAHTAALYRDMKLTDYNGSIVDFLDFLSAQHSLIQLKTFEPKDTASFITDIMKIFEMKPGENNNFVRCYFTDELQILDSIFFPFSDYQEIEKFHKYLYEHRFLAIQEYAYFFKGKRALKPFNLNKFNKLSPS